MLRGSWSKAFRAPNLVTVNESLVVRNNTRTDYTCQYAADFGGDPDQDTLDCRNTIQRRASGSKDLKAEKSDNTSIGIVLNPLDNLTFTFDYWTIKKKDTIGLFGEENHTLLDLFTRIEAGTGSCAGVGNPLLGRSPVDDEDIPFYEAAGICPAGDLDSVSDIYQNLDTRKVQGYDFGVYYDLDTEIGDWTATWVGTVYKKYDQDPGPAAQALLDAQTAGIIPDNYPVTGFADLMRMDGNQQRKMNARLRWRKNGWGASVAWFYLSNFYQSSLTLADGTTYVIPSMSTWNLSADYRFDLWSSSTRVRVGVNNVGNERAPLADRYFGYFSDAHRDYGRSYFIDLQMSW
jgi:outer membrane receptor protein involved in Fe transport